jgi:hypothetical protein
MGMPNRLHPHLRSSMATLVTAAWCLARGVGRASSAHERHGRQARAGPLQQALEQSLTWPDRPAPQKEACSIRGSGGPRDAAPCDAMTNQAEPNRADCRRSARGHQRAACKAIHPCANQCEAGHAMRLTPGLRLIIPFSVNDLRVPSRITRAIFPR